MIFFHSKSLLRFMVCILVAVEPIHASQLDTIITPPTGMPQAGQRTEFSVYIHNLGQDRVLVQLPAQSSCLLETDSDKVEVVANIIEPLETHSAVLQADEFIQNHYAFTLPEDVSGVVKMKVREFSAAAVMFTVVSSDSPERHIADDGDSERVEEYPTMDSLSVLYQPYLVSLTGYQPMYFLVGTNPEESKFQISFKYRFLDPEGDLAEDYPWMKGLHFGYTQTSFWDLESDSAPFDDTSYKPELFFLSSNIKKRPPWMQGLFLQTGFQHESNGRGGELSRSTNYVYFQPVLIFYDEASRLGFQVTPKVWAYLHNDDDTNPDLEDYRGFFDLGIKLGKADSFVLESHLWWAEEGISTQWDLTYPLHQHVFRHFGFYLQAQYVSALAESLIDYRKRDEAFRFGLAIVR